MGYMGINIQREKKNDANSCMSLRKVIVVIGYRKNNGLLGKFTINLFLNLSASHTCTALLKILQLYLKGLHVQMQTTKFVTLTKTFPPCEMFAQNQIECSRPV